MSSYSEKTFIVFLDLPNDISREIDLVREKYSNSGISYKSHITLKQDEDYLISPEKLVDVVSQIVQKEKPIKAEIRSVSTAKSDLGWNIYLPVKSVQLKRLAVKLSKALMPYVDPKSPRALLSTRWEQSKDFYLHISIKGTSDPNKFEKLYDSIQNETFNLKLPLQILCNKVVVAQWENTTWKAIKTIELDNV